MYAQNTSFCAKLVLACQKLSKFGFLEIIKKKQFLKDTVDGQNPAPPGMVKNPINNGIIIILGGAGFCPSTVSGRLDWGFVEFIAFHWGCLFCVMLQKMQYRLMLQ